MMWLQENQITVDALTQAIICEKARAIYADLQAETPTLFNDTCLTHFRKIFELQNEINTSLLRFLTKETDE